MVREKNKAAIPKQKPTQQFADGKGRDWLIELDLAAVDRVFQATGFNIYDLLRGPEGGAKLAADPSLHLRVIFELVRRQADDRKIDINEFKAGLGGMDTMEAIGDAFQDALVFFSPSRRRGAIRQVQETEKALTEATLAESQSLLKMMDPKKMARARLAGIRKELEEMNRGALTQSPSTGGGAGSNWPESAGSTPTAAD